MTIAKRDLKAGDRLDGIGGFCTYGLIDNVTGARAVGALPIGLSEGCKLLRDVSKDDVISIHDVESPRDGVADALWREQSARWPVGTQASRTQLAKESPRESSPDAHYRVEKLLLIGKTYECPAGLADNEF